MQDKVAVVTGGSKGIGLAIVQALVNEGCHVVAAARSSSERLDALVESGSVTVARLDLADPTAPAELVAAAGERLDILVNNVGAAATRTGGFLSVTDEEWMRSLNMNLLAAVRTTRSALPLMLDSGGGSIVNVCSVNAFLPDPLVIDYGAAKAALWNFSKALSKEVGPQGVRVNTVNPGPVNTDLWLAEGGVASTVAKSAGIAPEDVVRAAAGGSVTGRFTQPQEVADLVVFLASDRAANITGAGFTIDGGLVTAL